MERPDSTHTHTLTKQQQRFLKLLYKFRFVSSFSLSSVLGIRRDNTYKVLEYLVRRGLVVKVYSSQYRLIGRPAYYYLSKAGVSTVRELLDVKESVVHALYKNDVASADYVQHCLDITTVYPKFRNLLPDASDIFAKAELSRFTWFPNPRPDLYLRKPDGYDAFVVFVHDTAPFATRKRLDGLIQHMEDGEWEDEYPVIAFILKDVGSKYRFLYGAAKKLDNMGIEEDELQILATTYEELLGGSRTIWASVYEPKQPTTLLPSPS